VELFFWGDSEFCEIALCDCLVFADFGCVSYA